MPEKIEPLNIYQKLNAVMAEVDYIQKEKKSGMQYNIVSHDAVTALVRPHLQKIGVVYHPTSLRVLQDGNRTQVELTVRFANMDNPADFIDVPSLGYGVDTSDKGPGKAISYAVKYALLKTLGLETGDDADNDQTSQHQPAPKAGVFKPHITPQTPTQTQIQSSTGHLVTITDIKEGGDGASKWQLVTLEDGRKMFNNTKPKVMLVLGTCTIYTGAGRPDREGNPTTVITDMIPF